MSLKNFTIILPGGCNARCAFCDDRGDVRYPDDYLEQLQCAIATLPDDFTQVSITGGEPTISPVLADVLRIVQDSYRFDKVVLTTNGVRLPQRLKEICSVVDHLNISRHGLSEEDNHKAFGTKHVLADNAFESVCSYANSLGTDVNINYVYTKDSDLCKEDVESFVTKFSAKGVNKFTFRYDQRENSLDLTDLEKSFSHLPVVEKGGCPVCRSHTQIINGYPVTFKAAFDEPSIALAGSEGLYELIFHEDGTLAEDWSKTMPVKKKAKKDSPRLYTEEEVRRIVRAELKKKSAREIVYVPTSGGCGSSGGRRSSGGCGSSGGRRSSGGCG